MLTNLPKLAVYLARGLEGGGVTNYVRHLKAYYDSQNGVCDIYSPEFTRGRPLTSTDILPYIFTEDSFKTFYTILQQYDAVFVMWAPHKTMPAWYVDTYIEQLVKSKKPLIHFNFDHHYASFKTCARYDELLDAVDYLLTHSKKYCISGILRYLDKNNIKPKSKHLTFYNFIHNELLEDYIKFDKRAKKIIHLTRSTLWKRPGLLANSHEVFASRDWIVEILGMERSVNSGTFFRKYGHKNFFKTSNYDCKKCYPDPEYQYNIFKFLSPNVQRPDVLYLFGPYRYFDGMNRVAQSSFSLHPITFEHNGADLGGCAEFIFLESCLLSVPIAQTWTLDRVCLPYTNTPLSSLDFILDFSDDNARFQSNGLGPRIINEDRLIDRMEEIYNNSYVQTRRQLFDFMEETYSSKVLVPKLLKDVCLL